MVPSVLESKLNSSFLNQVYAGIPTFSSKNRMNVVILTTFALFFTKVAENDGFLIF